MVRLFMLKTLIPAEMMVFNNEVAGLWYRYLLRKPGDSLKPVVFRTPGSILAREFAESPETLDEQDFNADLIKSRISRKFIRKLPSNRWISFPIRRFLNSKERNNLPINYADPFSGPGNVAGGISPSAAGMDKRRLRGYVKFFKHRKKGKVTSVIMETSFKFIVTDAIDFCPQGTGDPGASFEQFLTNPLSRLEASKLTFDVLFKVFFKPKGVRRMV